jgi:hypothetical protein
MIIFKKLASLVKKKLFLLTAIVIVLGSLSAFFVFLSSSRYYAVFLVNGQVYFGHITNLNSSVLVLNNVYYLRTNTNLSNELLKKNKDNTDLHLSLIKLGKELHEPQDTMYINTAQVLYWEELQNDGKLIQAIKKDSPTR